MVSDLKFQIQIFITRRLADDQAQGWQRSSCSSNVIEQNMSYRAKSGLWALSGVKEMGHYANGLADLQYKM